MGRGVTVEAMGSGAVLTARQHVVAELVAHGLSNRAAARRLGVSEKTVEYHLTRVYALLGVRTRSQLTRRMIESGLTHVPMQARRED